MAYRRYLAMERTDVGRGPSESLARAQYYTLQFQRWYNEKVKELTSAQHYILYVAKEDDQIFGSFSTRVAGCVPEKR